MRNTAAIGALAGYLGINWETLSDVIRDTITRYRETNLRIARTAFEDLSGSGPKIDHTDASPVALLTGNEAIALGAVKAGLNEEDGIEPERFVLASGIGCHAKYAAHLKQLTALIKAAVRHPGFSFIDVLQPCFTFFNTYKLYNERVYNLVDDAHDPKNLDAAIEKSGEWSYGADGRIATGIFYQVKKPTYEERLLRGGMPVKMDAGALESVLRAHI